jgi:DNA-binding response OmpR family regulator
MRNSDHDTAEKENRLETHLQTRLGSRVRHLRVICRDAGVTLSGSTRTYHAKQLAQHLIMEITDLPILANEIEVLAGGGRDDGFSQEHNKGTFDLKPSILFADGDTELCGVYRRFATIRGYEAQTSCDGLDCITKLRQATPVVLVLDLELRWGGGDGVLAWLREEPQFLPSRVVLTSAEASAHILDRLALPPVVKTLTKPFLLSALLDWPAYNAPEEPKRGANGSQRRGILVVDDEPALRDILQTRLQQQGFHVWTAANGEEALDHCCNYSDEIAVILLDIQMPGLDGPKTFDGIRELDVDIPVCFMTGDPGEYETSDLLRNGARHCFNKPFRMDEIVRAVCNLANEPMGWPQEN